MRSAYFLWGRCLLYKTGLLFLWYLLQKWVISDQEQGWKTEFVYILLRCIIKKNFRIKLVWIFIIITLCFRQEFLILCCTNFQSINKKGFQITGFEDSKQCKNLQSMVKFLIHFEFFDIVCHQSTHYCAYDGWPYVYKNKGVCRYMHAYPCISV